MERHQALSFKLHLLTSRLDRAADRILQAEEGVSYSRFLALFMVSELDGATQRALARRLGVTEPSVSRMTASLVAAGHLDASPEPAGGNRRQLRLTPEGDGLVNRCTKLLEGRLTALVESSGIDYAEYDRHTSLLLTALDADSRQPVPSNRSDHIDAASEAGLWSQSEVRPR